MVSGQTSAWVDVAEEDETLVLSLHGELDDMARASIEPVMMAAVASARTVAIDLGDATFCDSSGVAMFFAAAQKAEAEGTRFWVRNPPRVVRRIFEIANLDREIDGCN
jgi:anti-anti-sigma factor